MDYMLGTDAMSPTDLVGPTARADYESLGDHYWAGTGEKSAVSALAVEDLDAGRHEREEWWNRAIGLACRRRS